MLLARMPAGAAALASGTEGLRDARYEPPLQSPDVRRQMNGQEDAVYCYAVLLSRHLQQRERDKPTITMGDSLLRFSVLDGPRRQGMEETDDLPIATPPAADTGTRQPPTSGCSTPLPGDVPGHSPAQAASRPVRVPAGAPGGREPQLGRERKFRKQSGG